MFYCSSQQEVIVSVRRLECSVLHVTIDLPFHFHVPPSPRVQLLLSSSNSHPPHPPVLWGPPLPHLHLCDVWHPGPLHLYRWDSKLSVQWRLTSLCYSLITSCRFLVLCGPSLCSALLSQFWPSSSDIHQKHAYQVGRINFYFDFVWIFFLPFWNYSSILPDGHFDFQRTAQGTDLVFYISKAAWVSQLDAVLFALQVAG